jgi:ribonuclease P protein component
LSSIDLRFPASARLGGRVNFSAVFETGVKASAGALTTYSRINGLGRSRLGISIGRRVGNAVRRNRIKRLLREAYRLDQHDLPNGYDWVIVVRPHQPMKLEDYRQLLAKLTSKCHAAWQRSV